jgi:hypothetical protein
MGSDLECWAPSYLEGLRVTTRVGMAEPGRHTGIVIDWADGYSRYPQEWKPLSLVALDKGQFALLPNNYLLYEDPHFVDPEARALTKYYRRGDRVWWEGDSA